jgi:hypothetical protein
MANRSPEIGVQVIRRESSWRNPDQCQWFVNIRVNLSHYKCMGPYEQEITLYEAMVLVATELRLNPLEEK